MWHYSRRLSEHYSLQYISIQLQQTCLPKCTSAFRKSALLFSLILTKKDKYEVYKLSFKSVSLDVSGKIRFLPLYIHSIAYDYSRSVKITLTVMNRWNWTELINIKFRNNSFTGSRLPRRKDAPCKYDNAPPPQKNDTDTHGLAIRTDGRTDVSEYMTSYH